MRFYVVWVVVCFMSLGCQGGTRPDPDQALPNVSGVERSETSVTTLATGANPICAGGGVIVGHNGAAGVVGDPGGNIHRSEYALAQGLSRTPSVSFSEFHPSSAIFVPNGSVMGAALPAGWRTRGDPSLGTADRKSVV